MSLGERVRERRADLGMTQTKLAELVGAQQPEVSRWEAGAMPKAETIVRIADALAVSVRWLITGADESSEPTPPRARTGTEG